MKSSAPTATDRELATLKRLAHTLLTVNVDRPTGIVRIEVRTKNRQLSALVEQMPGVVWSTDRDLRLLETAGAGLRGAGVLPDEQRGLGLADLFGVRRTTTTVVIDGNGVLRYCGQFRQKDGGSAEEALTAVLAGKEVAVKTTPHNG